MANSRVKCRRITTEYITNNTKKITLPDREADMAPPPSYRRAVDDEQPGSNRYPSLAHQHDEGYAYPEPSAPSM